MREEEVRRRLKEVGGSWGVFSKWMAGQTLGVYSDGALDYYKYDVERFIRYECNPANEPTEEWD